MFTLLNALAHLFGLDNGSGSFYLFWSGVAGDLFLVAGGYAWWRHHNCHVKRCWHLQWKAVPGTSHVTCRKHHPHDAPTAQQVLDDHSAARLPDEPLQPLLPSLAALSTVLQASEPGLGVKLQPRSPEWPRVRAAHLKVQPDCAVCGGTEQVEVHHIVPFHIDKTKELDPTNLITLCEKPSHNCHFVFGHFWNWTNSNPQVQEDAIHLSQEARKP